MTNVFNVSASFAPSGMSYAAEQKIESVERSFHASAQSIAEMWADQSWMESVSSEI